MAHRLSKRCVLGVAFLLIVLLLSFLVYLRQSCGGQSRLRPIAEFAPTEAVVVSELIFNNKYNGLELSRAILATGVKLIIMTAEPLPLSQSEAWLLKVGFNSFELSKIIVTNVQHEGLWVRDFGPIMVKETIASLPNTVRFVNFIYGVQPGVGDKASYQLALFLNNSIDQIPLPMDGGSFLSDGKRCFIAQDVLDEIKRQGLLRSEGNEDVILHRVTTYMVNVLGCEQTILLKNTPHVHLDMWFKIVNEHQAIISEVEKSTVDLLREQNHLVGLNEMNAIAQKLAGLKKFLSSQFEIFTLPLPVVTGGSFRNYTNAVLINRFALVPSYRSVPAHHIQYPDAPLTQEYENKVRQVYEKLGYSVIWVAADDFIVDGGALHCVTLQLPKM